MANKYDKKEIVQFFRIALETIDNHNHIKTNIPATYSWEIENLDEIGSIKKWIIQLF